MFMESWLLRVSCKVNVKPFRLHLFCKRPEVFMIPWTFKKLNSFLNWFTVFGLNVYTFWGRHKSYVRKSGATCILDLDCQSFHHSVCHSINLSSFRFHSISWEQLDRIYPIFVCALILTYFSKRSRLGFYTSFFGHLSSIQKVTFFLQYEIFHRDAIHLYFLFVWRCFWLLRFKTNTLQKICFIQTSRFCYVIAWRQTLPAANS